MENFIIVIGTIAFMGIVAWVVTKGDGYGPEGSGVGKRDNDKDRNRLDN